MCVLLKSNRSYITLKLSLQVATCSGFRAQKQRRLKFAAGRFCKSSDLGRRHRRGALSRRARPSGRLRGTPWGRAALARHLNIVLAARGACVCAGVSALTGVTVCSSVGPPPSRPRSARQRPTPPLHFRTVANSSRH